MDKPYIRKIRAVGKLTAWEVDGSFVRTRLDPDFTNFGQHYEFPFIPRNEIWIGRQFGKRDETGFYMEEALVQHRLMSEGVPFREARDRAKEASLRKRVEAGLAAAGKGWPGLDGVRLRRLEGGNGVRVWLVDGCLVRSMLFQDFTQGGHGRVYPFIPHDEIWIDDDVAPDERKLILLHELFERRLMGEGRAYNRAGAAAGPGRDAHDEANEVELFCRLNPGRLEARLQEEFRLLDGAGTGQTRDASGPGEAGAA
jgi:hypothetical protein